MDMEEMMLMEAMRRSMQDSGPVVSEEERRAMDESMRSNNPESEVDDVSRTQVIVPDHNPSSQNAAPQDLNNDEDGNNDGSDDDEDQIPLGNLGIDSKFRNQHSSTTPSVVGDQNPAVNNQSSFDKP
jgi:hypothetical protein